MMLAIIVLAVLWVLLENGAAAQPADVLEYPLVNQMISW